MAPSTRTRRILSTKQQLSTAASAKPLVLGKVSKAAAISERHGKISKSKQSACQLLVIEREAEKEEELRTRAESRQKLSNKRKRNYSQSEDEVEDEDSFPYEQRKASIKKTKFQLITPPHSQHNTDTEGSSPTKKVKVSLPTETLVSALPEGLQQLASLHASFVRAFSLHEAHNGLSAPAEVGDLSRSITRLWKRANVTQADLQRMLAIYEVCDLSVASSTTLDQVKSPFVLTTSGIGFNIRTNVEACYPGRTDLFDMQNKYEQKLVQVFDMLNSLSTSFVHGPQSAYPLLAVRVGTQTQTHRQTMSSIRADVLSKPIHPAKPASSELDFSKLSITDQMMDMTPTVVKSRTMSLFDRVRAKGIASSAAGAPTPAQLTRRHAIGRVPEVVEFLRMKQSQKSSKSSSILNFDDLEDDASSSAARYSSARSSRRISFSLTQAIREVRESVSVPMSAEEVSVIITILATELPELCGWVKIFTKGCVVSVTLDGAGLAMSGKEVGLLVDQREKSRS